jgi:hypothetical protein
MDRIGYEAIYSYNMEYKNTLCTTVQDETL